MATHNSGSPTTHLGRQMKRDREAHGWTLRELSARTGIDFSDLSKIENGKRPMTEKLAKICDGQFPERRGWYLAYYEESKSWMPPGFRDWSEYEARSRDLIIWVPGVVDGSAQTPGYARAVLETLPGVTPDQIATRLKGRMERQARLLREGGPAIVLLVDHVALYRAYGSAAVMAGQCARLTGVARLETVTVQVVPAVGHPLATASVLVADDAAYTEHALGGAVFTEEETVTRLRRLVGIVRGEARPVRESLAMIREAERAWNGARARTAPTAEPRASRSGPTT
jgi:transcriptional regulator with XRE-family HTH domain